MQPEVVALCAGRSIGGILGGRYRLDALIGPSENGCVYAATMVDSGWQVAVRVASLGEPRLRDRFMSMGPPNSGPNVLPIYDWAVDEQAFAYVVMYLVPEPRWTLAHLLTPASGPLAPARAKRIALQILSSLGSIHGDLRPPNVFLFEGDQVAVSDFGIRRALAEPKNTQAGARLRSEVLLYTAPERMRGSELDGRSDIYSVGVMLYQMLAGHPPYEVNDNMIKLAANIMTADPKKLPPSGLAAVALNAMHKRPEQRMTGAEMWEALSG